MWKWLKNLFKPKNQRYNAQISEADATIQIYLEKPVAIGEHPQHLDEIDKLITKIAEAEEKIEVLQQFKL